MVDLYDGLAGTISAPRPKTAKPKDPHPKPGQSTAPKGGTK
jgi:hypothetical protein